LDFLLNLKKIRFSYDGKKPIKLTLSAKTAGEVKAGDIKTGATVKVTNPDLVLANLSKGGSLEAELTLENGVGYVMADDKKQDGIGVIPLDATFSPIERVNVKVEETRVGRLTNYDKLTMEIWTDGTISPKSALTESAKFCVPIWIK
jgi:DNA-directed RNA polymerase subunit alpha